MSGATTLRPPAFLHTADLHLGANLRKFDRLAEQQDRLNDAVKLAVERELSAFVIAGDVLFDRLSREDAAIVIRQMVTSFLPLARAGIPVLTLLGNHDFAEHFDMMRAVMRLATAASAAGAQGAPPPLIAVKDASVVRVGGIQFVCVPYPEREAAAASAGHTYEDEADARVERNRAVTDAIEQRIRHLIAQPTFQSNLPSVLVGHFTLANAQTPDDEDRFLNDWSGDFVVGPSAIPNRFSYGAFGHIHMPQNLHTTKVAALPFPSRYAGSMVRLGMGERSDEKSVSIVTLDAARGWAADIEVLPLVQTPMAHLDLTLEELEALETRWQQGDWPYAQTYVRVYLHHDGTQSRARLTSRLTRLFPYHVGFSYFGPEMAPAILAAARDAGVAAAPAAVLQSDPSDRQATVREYLSRRFEGNTEFETLLAIAATAVAETEAAIAGTKLAGEDDCNDDSAGGRDAADPTTEAA